ncbi:MULTISPECIES: hypothetical protein [unclassified Nonomuraea]|uniref:hypothetical protein n=1 Tax=unclassified Nonomuraea TaxID=2593643 RepID=UPI0033D0C93A
METVRARPQGGRGQAVDEDTAYTHLQLAARYLGKMTALAEHFTQQAAPSSADGT